jgi:sec-independent protein translocase protein TatB
MFDIGFWEVIVVTLVALLVVGPERLPGLAREIGRFVGKTRRFVQSVRSDIEQELQTEELRKMLQGQEKEIQELKSMMRDTETSLREDLKDTEDSLRVDLGDDLTGPDRKPPGPKSAKPGAGPEKPARGSSAYPFPARSTATSSPTPPHRSRWSAPGPGRPATTKAATRNQTGHEPELPQPGTPSAEATETLLSHLIELCEHIGAESGAESSACAEHQACAS